MKNNIFTTLPDVPEGSLGVVCCVAPSTGHDEHGQAEYGCHGTASSFANMYGLYNDVPCQI